MHDQIPTHDPVTWKLILIGLWAIIVNQVFPWGVHALSIFTASAFSYFAFNYVKNKADELAKTKKWIRPFLHNNGRRKDN